jgi:hypothetical protein
MELQLFTWFLSSWELFRRTVWALKHTVPPQNGLPEISKKNLTWIFYSHLLRNLNLSLLHLCQQRILRRKHSQKLPSRKHSKLLPCHLLHTQQTSSSSVNSTSLNSCESSDDNSIGPPLLFNPDVFGWGSCHLLYRSHRFEAEQCV